MFLKVVVKKIETNFIFNNTFSENFVIYDTVCKYVIRVIEATDENIIWRMRCGCTINQATDTHILNL